MNPIISIIIPVYNQEETLSKCLDSVLGQEFSDFEVLLIDDASIDFTAQICSNYAKKDARIKVITNASNKGQGYSRNLALTQARGQYVTFVDSDDYITSILLQHGVQILEERKDVDMVHFDAQNMSAQFTDACWSRIPPGCRAGVDVFQDFCYGKIASHVAWGKVYRKNFLEQHNIFFSKYLWEDYVFVIKSYYYAHNIYFTGEHGYTRIYAPHPGSITKPTKTSPRHIRSRCQLAYDMQIFFESIGPQFTHCHQMRYSSFMNMFRMLLPYIAQSYARGICPFSSEDMDCIAAAPIFLECILKEYAMLFAESNVHVAGTAEKISVNVIQELAQDGNMSATDKVYIDSLLHYIHNENAKDDKYIIEQEYIQAVADNRKLLSFVLENYAHLSQEINSYQCNPESQADKQYEKNVIDIQTNLELLALRNGFHTKLGTVCVEGFSSLKSFLALPFSLYALLRSYIQKKVPSALGGANFNTLVEIYDKQGFDGAVVLLDGLVMSPRVRANAYTALARHVQKKSAKKCAEFAYLAYVADPHPFRLKWLLLRSCEAGDVHTAKAALNLLPKDMPMKDVEKNKINRMTRNFSI